MPDLSIEAAASRLLAARRERRPIPVPVSGLAGADDAFAVQDAVARALGPAGAWKIGGGNPQAAYTAAPIAASLVRPSPCRWPAAELIRIGIEVEVAVRIGRDLTDPAPSAEAVGAAIASVHAAIEIVDSRFDTWPVPDPLWALADNQNNGGFVPDPAGRPWTGHAPDRAHVRIVADGAVLFDREGVNPGGDPLALVVRLAAHAAARGGLKAGDYVTTGSLNGITFVEPGAQVVAEVEGLGRVEFDLPV